MIWYRKIFVLLNLAALVFSGLIFNNAKAEVTVPLGVRNLIATSSLTGQEGKCGILLGWASPDFEAIKAKIGEDFNINWVQLNVYVQQKNVGEVAKKELGYNARSYENFGLACNKTYVFSVETLYRKTASNIMSLATVNTGSFFLELPSSSGSSEGRCAVKNLKGQVGSSGNEKRAYLTWDLPPKSDCPEVHQTFFNFWEYVISPGDPEDHYKGAAFTDDSIVITGKTTFTIKTAKGNQVLGTAKITVDPGEIKTSDPVNTPDVPAGDTVDTDGDGIPDAPGSGNPAAECLAKCPQGKFQIGINIHQAICQAQCNLINWISEFIGTIVDKLLRPSLGIQNSNDN